MAWQKTEEQHHAYLHPLSKNSKEIALKYDPKWIECSMTKGFEKCSGQKMGEMHTCDVKVTRWR